MRLHPILPALYLSLPLWAQDPTPQNLREVVISAARMHDSVAKAPSAITVLSPADLLRQGFTDIAPAANMVPGVLMQAGALNTNRISVRGIGARTPFGTNRIRAFYGPIPLTSGDGETTIDDLDPEFLGNMEFVRGPRASIYGAGLGGAILISPYLASEDPSAKINTTYGSYGLRKSSYLASAARTAVHYHHMHIDGWRQNSTYDREGTTLTSHFPAGKNGRILFLGNFTTLKALIPSSITAEAFENNPRVAAPTWLASKGFEQYDSYMGGAGYEATSGKIRPSIAVFASGKDGYEPRPFDILDQRGFARGGRAQATAPVMIGTRQLRVSGGAEYFKDRLRSSNFENLYQQNDGNGSLQGARIASGKQSRSFVNAFAQATTNLGRLGVQAGVNLNSTQFDTSGDQAGNYAFKLIWSPEVSVSYTLKTGLLYVSAGKGFSLPSVQETLDATRNFNRSLRHENGLSLEAGAKTVFLNGRLKADAAIFHMAVSDLLVARRIADDQYVGINAGRTLHQGAELLARYTSRSAGIIRLSAYFSGSAGRFTFKSFRDGDNDFSGNELTGVPKTKIAVGITAFHKVGLYASLDALAMGRLPVNDANSVYSDAYETFHGRVGYRREILDGLTFELAAGALNIFNARYASMVQVNATSAPGLQPRYFYPGAPANFYGHVGISYRPNN